MAMKPGSTMFVLPKENEFSMSVIALLSPFEQLQGIILPDVATDGPLHNARHNPRLPRHPQGVAGV
jgi:hypothetical protein